jgi:hypothetical protein
MNNIGIDARASNIIHYIHQSSKQSVGFGTDSVGASLALEEVGWGPWQDRNESR